MDQISGVLFVFFVLSMVTERLGEFLRYWGPFLTLIRIKDVTTKRDTPAEEQKRYFQNLKINIPIGISVALILKADIFSLINDSASGKFHLGWENRTDDQNIVWIIFGCFITGFFISFGSKLWHDLLDIVLEIKRAKQQINDDNSDANTTSIDPNDLNSIVAASDNYKKELIKIKGVVSVALANSDSNPQLEVRTDNSFDTKTLIPKKIFYDSSDGQKKSFDVVILNTGIVKAHSIQISPANKIGNQNPFYSGCFGSLGCFVKKNGIVDKTYLLTCFHVVKSQTQTWDEAPYQPRPNEKVILLNANKDVLGFIADARRDNQIDAAIVELDSAIIENLTIPDLGIPLYSRDVFQYDINTKVKMYGLLSYLSEGYIYDINVPVKISYGDGTSQQIDKAIKISTSNGSSFSQEGDSGSIVMDEFNYVIGLLVSGFDNFSYVIPFSTISTIFKINLNLQS